MQPFSEEFGHVESGTGLVTREFATRRLVPQFCDPKSKRTGYPGEFAATPLCPKRYENCCLYGTQPGPCTVQDRIADDGRVSNGPPIRGQPAS